MSEKVIDSLSNTKLTLFPFIQVEKCGSYSAPKILNVSDNVNHKFNYSIVSPVMNVKRAWKHTDYIVKTHAAGQINNALGWKLRDWTYDAQLEFVGGW